MRQTFAALESSQKQVVRILRGTLRAALRRALGELPVDLRAPVVLRDIEGLSTREAAAVLDLGEPAFKSRLHRGRIALRSLLTPWVATSDL